jgi:hypothetical protein
MPVVLIMQGDFAAGLPLLRDALDELREGGAAPGYPAFLALFARGLGLAGQVTEGLAVIDQALELSERHEERWSLPEVLRNKASFCCSGGRLGLRLRPRIASGRRSTGRFATVRSLTNCGPRSASAAYGATRDAVQRHTISWQRSMAASPKGSTPPICKRARNSSTS